MANDYSDGRLMYAKYWGYHREELEVEFCTAQAQPPHQDIQESSRKDQSHQILDFQL